MSDAITFQELMDVLRNEIWVVISYTDDQYRYQWSVCALKTPGVLFLPLVVVEVRTSLYLFALTVYCVCPSDGGSANSLLSLEHPMGWLDEINE